MPKYFFLLSLFLSFNSLACENVTDYKNNFHDWLGNNSEFSKKFLESKCILDEKLAGLPLAKKKLITRLISKSYEYEESNGENYSF